MHDCFSQLPRHPAGATPSFIKTGTLRRCRSENCAFIYTYFMIKLVGRENMKNWIKFLLAVFTFSPMMSAVAAPISQTVGSNLTGYNGAMGANASNQWNTMTNQRQNTSSTAKADYGNCEAVVLRCAKPKCSGSGCADFNVAKSIAAGCVNSNSACKKHGDALADFIAGQLVSSSQAVAQQQQAAAQSAAAQQSAEQIAQMQQQMQMQMQQMQEQNNAQLASLQNALEESQRAAAEAQAAAVASATAVASAPDADTGLTAAQSAAAKSGVSEDTIARATITGQIMTSLDGVDSSLANLKSTMREAFRYAGCNEVNGDNCTGPKRVKKFRELANKFFDPYDALERNLEEALNKAESVGVDMGNIYMYFSGSCNRWAEFICRGDALIPATDTDGATTYTLRKYDDTTCDVSNNKAGKSKTNYITRGGKDCSIGQVIPVEDLVGCTVNKYLDMNSPDITDRVLNPMETDNATIRVGCASDIGSKLMRHRRSSGRGKEGVDIDLLQYMLNQSEGGGNVKLDDASLYCGLGIGGQSKGNNANAAIDAGIKKLQATTVSKTLTGEGSNGACCVEAGQTCTVDCYDMNQDVSYVAPVFALCDTHAYNIQYSNNNFLDTSDIKEKMNKVIGLKTTVIAQQMYKQYNMLEKMIRQVKIMLEKETLRASLQVAGGTSDDGADSSFAEAEFDNCRAKGDDSSVLSCLRSNFAQYGDYVNKGNRKASVIKAMKADSDVLEIYCSSENKDCLKATVCDNMKSGKNMTDCYGNLEKRIRAFDKQIREEEQKSSGGKTIKLEL